jgi:hypothetical protein
MREWIKNIIKKLFKKNGLKRGKDFDFEHHLTTHNFVLNTFSISSRVYIHKQCKFMLIINLKNSTLSIISKKTLVSKLNFIPNSEVFLDIYLNLTIQKLIHNDNNEDEYEV